jgi:hypothetical protein
MRAPLLAADTWPSRKTVAIQPASPRASMIDWTLGGEKNCAGEIVPAFICTNEWVAFRLPGSAAKIASISGGGGAKLAAAWRRRTGTLCSNLGAADN